uniref:Translocase of chloroplast 90, chloroplastic n=1 Tax=Anthurium amnicola TaxID=1678845 RepID=A0A1D1ZGX9_9ARAE
MRGVQDLCSYLSRMKTFREWISHQIESKSLLSSARPFSFFETDLPNEDIRDQGMAIASAASEAAPVGSINHGTSGNQVRGIQPHPEVVASEDLHHSHLSTTCHSIRDPLANVEVLQINFLRLVHRIGMSLGNHVVAQVLYRLQLADAISTGETGAKGPNLRIDEAKAIAAELEAADQNDLDFSLKILVIGKTGVGKSATINSIFEETKTETNAFRPATKCIQEIFGTLKGIKLTIIDTPGLLPSHSNQRHNKRVMLSIKRFIKKSPPDIVLYFERLDVINMGYSDFPLLKLMTDVLGSSVWCNTIVVLTHSSAIREGPSGYPVNYEVLVNQCKNLIQHYINQAISDTRLENPILLVENNPFCKTNLAGEMVLPNGIVWRLEFLLLCASMKVLADANALLKFQDSFQIGQTNSRLPSLPHLLSSLLQPHSMSSSSGSEDGLDELSDLEDEDDYDRLPPIRILTKAQFQRLSKSQKSDYLYELHYRETLYLKKQLKREVQRQKGKIHPGDEFSNDNVNDDVSDTPEAVALPDMAIPLSFDSDHPVYRYRYLAHDDQWLVRPVLDSQGWDHDAGFDGINLETSRDVNRDLHVSVVGQMSKDKQECNILTECAAKYSGLRSSIFSGGTDIQTTGKDLVYTIRGGAKIRNLGHNMTGGGISLTSFGSMYVTGAKVEDSISIGKRLKLSMNTGCIRGCGRMAYGGSLEASIFGRDHPVRDDKLTLAMTCLSFEKETVVGGILQSDFQAGHSTKMSVKANLNSRNLGNISLKTSTSHDVEIALIAVVSLVQALFRRRFINNPDY